MSTSKETTTKDTTTTTTTIKWSALEQCALDLAHYHGNLRVCVTYNHDQQLNPEDSKKFTEIYNELDKFYEDNKVQDKYLPPVAFAAMYHSPKNFIDKVKPAMELFSKLLAEHKQEKYKAKIKTDKSKKKKQDQDKDKKSEKRHKHKKLKIETIGETVKK